MIFLLSVSSEDSVSANIISCQKRDFSQIR
jgi:hypothetical protein